MSASGPCLLNVDFSIYRSGGTKTPNPEEEKIDKAVQFAESLGLDYEGRRAIEEASSAIGCAEHLSELSESGMTFSTEYPQARLIHLRLQGHRVAEAYKILMTIENVPPDAIDVVRKTRNGLGILFKIISKALREAKDHCDCEACVIGKKLQ